MRLNALERYCERFNLPGFAQVARSCDSRTVNAVLIACLQQMALDMEPLGYGAELLAAVMKESVKLDEETASQQQELLSKLIIENKSVLSNFEKLCW